MSLASDPFLQFKLMQREGWALFAPLEIMTTRPAAALVTFAGVKRGERVLDAGCGTGVVAVTAARGGAEVRGLDLSPVLLAAAQRSAALAGVAINFMEGDIEALPYPDASFDVVLSQFGHMFAPRPAVAVAELLRVLVPGGRIAFSTWPPELFTGRMFALVAQYLPLPAGAVAPETWGDPGVVRERLGEVVSELCFERELLQAPSLSPAHFRQMMESTAGPIIRLQQHLQSDPDRLARFRADFEALVRDFHVDNTVRQHYLMSRARKR